MFDDEVERICEVDPVTGKVRQAYSVYNIYPANGYATSMDIMERAAKTIEEELEERLDYFEMRENHWKKSVWNSVVVMI